MVDVQPLVTSYDRAGAPPPPPRRRRAGRRLQGDIRVGSFFFYDKLAIIMLLLDPRRTTPAPPRGPLIGAEPSQVGRRGPVCNLAEHVFVKSVSTAPAGDTRLLTDTTDRALYERDARVI